MPAAKGVHGDQQHGGVENSGRRRFGKKSVKSNKEKINEIKERHRRKGMEVCYYVKKIYLLLLINSFEEV